MTRPVIVFTGDSITDCDRRTDPDGLGDGYVRLIAGSTRARGLRRRQPRASAGTACWTCSERWENDVSPSSRRS